MLIKNKTFKGGYRLKRFEGEPEERLIEIGIPDRVIIPLKQGFGDEVPATVKEGEVVKAGQIIGINNNTISSPVHSSVNGKVEEIKKINYFKQEINAVVIKSDPQNNELKRLEGYSPNWDKLPTDKLEELLYLSGVTSLDKEGIPTKYKSSIIMPKDVENLIIHGVGSEVYNLSLSLLLSGKKLFNFIDGIKILKKIMPNAKVHLALNKYHKNLIEQIVKLTANYDWIDIYSLEPKYPQGYDEVIVPTILGKKFPYGYSAANIGVVVLNIQAVLQVYQAVAEGKPLIERTVALCGPGFKERPHIKVRIGTPLQFIVNEKIRKDIDLRFILNSPLTGTALSDLSLPINRTFTAIISLPEDKRRRFISFMNPGFKKDSYSNTFLSKFFKFKKGIDTNVKGEKRPCIFCNFCEEVCPVNIIPHLIYHYVERDIVDERLMKYDIFNCIECNLCSYVCPSKIPVAKFIKEGQEKLITKGCDRSLCILPYFDMKGLEEYRGIKELQKK